jgi:hypothetical protein
LSAEEWVEWSDLQYLNTQFCWPDTDDEEKKCEKREGKMKGEKNIHKTVVSYHIETCTVQRLIIQCGLCLMICVQKEHIQSHGKTT